MPSSAPTPVRSHATRYQYARPQPCPGIESLSRCIHEQFGQLPVVVEFVDHDPYRDFWEMQAALAATKRLLVAVAQSDSIFTKTIKWQFRAVHDVDHLREGVPFHFLGECQAARIMCRRMPNPIHRQIVFSEIVCQAACFSSSGVFPRQKFVPIPEPIQCQFIGGGGNKPQFEVLTGNHLPRI